MTSRCTSLLLPQIVLSLMVFSSVIRGSSYLNSRSFTPDAVEIYKEIDGRELELFIFYPDGKKPATPAPAIIFFHGGGFSKGTPSAFYYAADYFASRGMVAISARYRLRSKKSDKLDCLKDAKSAMRYVFKNAAALGVNPNKVVAAGGSAGGSLAGATATSKIINEETDDLSISTVPAAIVLFNPIGIGTNKQGMWTDEIKDDFSPGRKIEPGIPPTLVMIGDQDKFIDPETVKSFQTKLQDVGTRCDLALYPGAKHSFFDNSEEWVIETLGRADTFLSSLGILQGKPSVAEWIEDRKN